MDTLELKIRTLLEEYFATESEHQFFVYDVSVNPTERIYVYVDSEEAMTIEHCRTISRYLEKELESREWVGQSYLLEVSSPGVGKPLLDIRQYRKNIGRTLTVKRNSEEKETEGKLTAVTETGITLWAEAVVKAEGTKKKEKVEITTEIPFEDISKAVVKIVF